MITKTFQESTITTVQYGALGVAILIFVLALVRSIIAFIRARVTVDCTEENAYAYIRQDEN